MFVEDETPHELLGIPTVQSFVYPEVGAAALHYNILQFHCDETVCIIKAATGSASLHARFQKYVQLSLCLDWHMGQSHTPRATLGGFFPEQDPACAQKSQEKAQHTSENRQLGQRIGG